MKNEAICPDSLVVLKQSDKFLMERVMKHTKAQIEGTHYNVQDMKRRLKAYRTANESTIAEPALKQFFTENKT